MRLVSPWSLCVHSTPMLFRLAARPDASTKPTLLETVPWLTPLANVGAAMHQPGQARPRKNANQRNPLRQILTCDIGSDAHTVTHFLMECKPRTIIVGACAAPSEVGAK